MVEAVGRRQEAAIKLRRFRLRRFKAIAEIDLSFEQDLLLLIGQNGAGKSSLLQALSFIRYFAEGRADAFFKDRGWEQLDVRHRANAGRAPVVIGFDLLLEHAGREVVWQFEWGLKSERTLAERLWVREGDGFRRIARFNRSNGLQVGMAEPTKLRLNGSFLSVVEKDTFERDEDLAEQVLVWALGVTSLELLSPRAIRSSVRGTATDIGPRGERLAGFMAGLSASERAEITARLSRYYPVENIDTVRKRAGWIDMKIKEVVSGLSFSVEHLSDGFLRLLALAAIPALNNTASLILLDEIEDGIEPHILPTILTDLRAESRAQLVVTSHSPVLLNAIEPQAAVLLHRDESGRSQATPLQEIKTFSSGDDLFGAGELWLNTSLPALAKQATTAAERKGPISFEAFISADRVSEFADR